MKLFFNNLAVVLLGTVAVGVGAQQRGEPLKYDFEVVMRSGEVIKEMDESAFPTFRNDKCRVRFPGDGNFGVEKIGFNVVAFDANANSPCATSEDPMDKMSYRLLDNGEFVSYCGTEWDYTTQSGQSGDGRDYIMGIDENCDLHIFEGRLDCDSVWLRDEIWTNVHYTPLHGGSLLGQGEIVHDKQTGNKLVMRSSDGNLVLYGPKSNLRTEPVLWAANREWNRSPDLGYKATYARVSPDGVLSLIGKNGEGGGEVVYFSKPLAGATAGECFIVGFDEEESDLVAFPCSN